MTATTLTDDCSRRLFVLEQDTRSLEMTLRDLKVRIRALNQMGCVYAVKTTDNRGVVRTVSPYDLLAGAAAAARDVAAESASKYSVGARSSPHLWAVHNVEAIPALTALHNTNDQDRDSYVIVAGHIIRVNSPKFVANGKANYAQCILAACSAVYTVRNFASFDQLVDGSQSIADNVGDDGLFDLETFPQIMPYIAARRALSHDFYGDGDDAVSAAAVSGVTDHPIAGSVVRMFLVMFERFNPDVARADQGHHARIAWTFACNFWTLFTAARSIPKEKVSYPTFSRKVSTLFELAEARFGDVMFKQAGNEPLLKKLERGPGDMILNGLGKMLLGIPNTVDFRGNALKRQIFTNFGGPSSVFLSKELYDDLVRRPIFRNDVNDPTQNTTSLCAEIVAAMAFSETTRWQLQLIDVLCMLAPNLSSRTAPPIEDMFFSENGGKKTDDGRQSSFIGPYGDFIKGNKWAGIFPMSHNGSVDDAAEAMGPNKDKRINPLLMKCMRLYADFFVRKLGNPRQNGGLSLELVPVELTDDMDTLVRAQAALATTYESLNSHQRYVYASLVDREEGEFLRSLVFTSIDDARSNAKPDLPPTELAEQDVNRFFMGVLPMFP